MPKGPPKLEKEPNEDQIRPQLGLPGAHLGSNSMISYELWPKLLVCSLVALYSGSHLDPIWAAVKIKVPFWASKH